MFKIIFKLIINFNSQLHAGADLNPAGAKTGYRISIHSSTQELTLVSYAACLYWMNFNSQLHAGADMLEFDDLYQGDFISIHSSTQELTVLP